MGLFSFLSRGRLRDILQAVHQLIQGHYPTRLDVHSSDELGQLEEKINLLAGTVHSQVEALIQDKTQLTAILANMVEAVVAVDQSSRILATNPALRQLFGLDPSHVIGRPFLDVLRHSQLDDLVRFVLADGHDRVEEVRTFEPVERLFEAHAVPLNVNGAQQGALLVLHDITRLRRLEQIRREFVANVSHELRTPLAAMRGLAETLKLGAVDDKENRMEFLSGIENHAEQMTLLVDDLLDLAAIESGKRAPKPSMVDLAELAQEVMKTLKPLAVRRKVKLVFGSASSSVNVPADRTQLKQVFTNLIDNAIKFNNEGGSVEIMIASEGKQVKVSVKDTGMGIPSDALARVFERFFRVDKARSKELGGTGLGLAIVKHIIESHRGTVSVESTEGQGSTFQFTLPT